jgi:hypothetical protein
VVPGLVLVLLREMVFWALTLTVLPPVVAEAVSRELPVEAADRLCVLLSELFEFFWVTVPPLFAAFCSPDTVVVFVLVLVVVLVLPELLLRVFPLALTATLCLLALALPPVFPLDWDPVGVIVVVLVLLEFLVLPLTLVAVLPVVGGGAGGTAAGVGVGLGDGRGGACPGSGGRRRILREGRTRAQGEDCATG